MWSRLGIALVFVVGNGLWICRRWAFVATKPAVNLYAWVMRTTPNDQATDRQVIVVLRFSYRQQAADRVLADEA